METGRRAGTRAVVGEYSHVFQYGIDEKWLVDDVFNTALPCNTMSAVELWCYPRLFSYALKFRMLGCWRTIRLNTAVLDHILKLTCVLSGKSLARQVPAGEYISLKNPTNFSLIFVSRMGKD